MSDYEKHIGKLKKVDLSEFNYDIEKFFETQYRKEFVELEDFEIQSAYILADNYKYRGDKGPWQWLYFDNTENYNKFYVVKGNIYETIEDKEVDEASFFKDNGDGTYDYFMEFYNGGTCLSECIEDKLEKLK